MDATILIGRPVFWNRISLCFGTNIKNKTETWRISWIFKKMRSLDVFFFRSHGCIPGSNMKWSSWDGWNHSSYSVGSWRVAVRLGSCKQNKVRPQWWLLPCPSPLGMMGPSISWYIYICIYVYPNHRYLSTMKYLNTHRYHIYIHR